MPKPFKNLLLFTRQHHPTISLTFKQLIEYLRRKGITPYVDEETARKLQLDCDIFYASQSDDRPLHLVLAIGGDGNFLSAAKLALEYQLPILGVNQGHLGFLTDVYPDALEEIAHILKGHYLEEYRTVLQCSLLNANNESLAEGTALNEVILSPRHSPQLIEFDVLINQQFVCSQRADGMIIATPTGSTAYALSAGGPILHPSLDAFVLVPMFPHHLSSRPLVIKSSDSVCIRVNNATQTKPYMSCDSHFQVAVSGDAQIHIAQHRQQLHLIHPHHYNYFHTLRTKLHWESKQHVNSSKN